MKADYRADIQGLRAVAVLLVALDHARIGPFHGGFVGVDVFFVISGYLITSLLLRERDGRGRISLRGFYARRARRILPAALLVTVATVVLSVLYLDGARALAVAEQAIWVTYFAANIKFAAEETDYFGSDTLASPLQHYWSLSVEEQFYLVWPLILIAAIALLARRLGGPRRAAIAVLVVILAVSFYYSVHLTAADPLAAYFSTPARAYELALGALAAAVTPYVVRSWPTVLPRLLALGSWVGIGLIGYAALTFSVDTPFPGSAAAVPTVGTALLLLGGLGAAAWGPQRALSVWPMRRVGDWSYSFYLWHWPLIVIADYQFGDIAGWRGALVLAVALAVSAATYRWVETPFRTGAFWRKGTRRGLMLYPATLLLVLPTVAVAEQVVRSDYDDGGAAITTANFGQGDADGPVRFGEDPFVALVEASVLAAENGVPIPGDLQPNPLDLAASTASRGDCPYFGMATADLHLCPRGDTEGDKVMVVLGDSHARQWVPALEAIARDQGYVLYALVREACPAVDATPRSTSADTTTACVEFRAWALDTIDDLRPDATVLATDANELGFIVDGEVVDGDKQVAALVESGLSATIERVQDVSGNTYVIGDPPTHLTSPSECLTRPDPTLLGCLSAPEARSEQMTAATQRAAAATGADFVVTRPWFCVDDRCPTVVGRLVTHRDIEHITVEYSTYLAPALARAMGIPYGG